MKSREATASTKASGSVHMAKRGNRPVNAVTLRHSRLAKQSSRLVKRAQAILGSDDPIVMAGKALRDGGYGGDLRPALLTYLAASTRLLAMRDGEMPAHLLLVGPPAAGKSHTLKAVLRLLPARAQYVIDAGSPRVLIYDKVDLRNRVLVFGESDSLPAGEDNPAASAVRNLLQDHRLHYRVTVRNPRGGFSVKQVDKPVVLLALVH